MYIDTYSHRLNLKINKYYRMEKETNAETGEVTESFVDDTPLLINIKGCGYPPNIVCDDYADKYNNFSIDGVTFPCYYSQMNPWIVLSKYNEYAEKYKGSRPKNSKTVKMVV